MEAHLREITARAEELQTRRSALASMLEGMANPQEDEQQLFDDDECNAVQRQLRALDTEHGALVRRLEASTELYHDHVVNLEMRLRRRSEYLSAFDEVLRREPEVASALVEKQRELQGELKELQQAILEEPS